jgi:hypothetical protein
MLAKVVPAVSHVMAGQLASGGSGLLQDEVHR